MSDATVRRLSPPDRRSPVLIARGACPLNSSCYCCPNYGPRKRGDSCPTLHPPEERKCSLPYPENIPACRERDTLPQQAPPAPAGFRIPHMACCVECGRVTARRWTDPEGRVLPWCAGLFPDPEAM